MRKLKIVLVMTVLLGLAAGLAGCGGDEDNPVNVQADTMTLDSNTAEDFSLQALDVVSEMVTEVPDIAAADFGAWAMSKTSLAKANSDSVTWDPAHNAWVFTYAGPLLETTPPNYWNFSLDLWVQYRNAMGPMQYPLGATQMEMRYGTGMDMHLEEGGDMSEMTYQMDTRLTVSYLGEGGAYGVVGSGNTVVDVNQVTASHSESGHFAMDWSLDVTVSDQGCPSGTATVNAQEFQLLASYDGQGNVTWTLTGPNYNATGTDIVGCGSPVQ